MFATLNDSALSMWLNSLIWGFPFAEIFHIVMTGGFFGGIALLDLRLLGVHRRVPISLLLQHGVPCLGWLFAGVVVSGAVLFMFMPLEYSQNPAFLAKLLLIPAGGLNALWMHMSLLRNLHHWDSNAAVPAPVKLAALLSLVIWMSTLAAGRLIAYFYGAHG